MIRGRLLLGGNSCPPAAVAQCSERVVPYDIIMGYKVLAEWKGRPLVSQPNPKRSMIMLSDAIDLARELVGTRQATKAVVIDMGDSNRVLYRYECPIRRMGIRPEQARTKNARARAKKRAQTGGCGAAGRTLRITIAKSKQWGVAARGKYVVACSRGLPERTRGFRRRQAVKGKDAAIQTAMKTAQTLVNLGYARRVDVFCEGHSVGHAKL